MPRPTPTAIPTIKAAMSTLTMMRLRLLNDWRQLQLCRFILATLAFLRQCSWPGQTWQSVPPFVHSVDLRLHVSVVMMASMSVSKGLLLWQLAGVAGVERSEVRGCTCVFSAVGGMMSEASVSWDGFWMRRVVVVSTVRPTFSGLSLQKLEAMVSKDRGRGRCG